MTEGDDKDQQLVVAHGVDHAVVAHTDAQEAVRALQGLRAVRTRIRAQRLDRVKQTALDGAIFDPAVHAFWRSITAETESFVELVETAPLTIPEWLRQREIYRAADESDQLAPPARTSPT